MSETDRHCRSGRRLENMHISRRFKDRRGILTCFLTEKGGILHDLCLTGAVILPFNLILYHGFVKTIPGKKRHPQMPVISKKGIGYEREDKQWL